MIFCQFSASFPSFSLDFGLYNIFNSIQQHIAIAPRESLPKILRSSQISFPRNAHLLNGQAEAGAIWFCSIPRAPILGYEVIGLRFLYFLSCFFFGRIPQPCWSKFKFCWLRIPSCWQILLTFMLLVPGCAARVSGTGCCEMAGSPWACSRKPRLSAEAATNRWRGGIRLGFWSRFRTVIIIVVVVVLLLIKTHQQQLQGEDEAATNIYKLAIPSWTVEILYFFIPNGGQ